MSEGNLQEWLKNTILERLYERVRSYTEAECNIIAGETEDEDEREELLSCAEDVEIETNSEGEALSVTVTIPDLSFDGGDEVAAMLDDNIQTMIDTRIDGIAQDFLDDNMEEITKMVAAQIEENLGGR